MKILAIAIISTTFVLGCSNPCEKRCDEAYDEVKANAGSNFSGAIESGAKQGPRPAKRCAQVIFPKPPGHRAERIE